MYLTSWPAPLTASAFNKLGQYANIPVNRAYFYAKLAISSLLVAVTIASTHFAYPWSDGQPVPDFRVSTVSRGKTFAILHGEVDKMKLSSAYSLSNKCNKNYCNWRVHIQVIVKALITCF